MLSLIKSTRNGRFKAAGAKIGTLICLTSLLSCAFYVSNLIFAENLLGYGDLSRNIQSMRAFRNANIVLSVGQYLGLFLCTKLASLVLFSVIAASFFAFFSSAKFSYITVGALLVISFACYTFIHPVSYINVLKYINIFAFLDTFSFWGDYVNLNIFGFPISRVMTSIVVIIILTLAVLILYLWLFSRASDKGRGFRLRMPKFIREFLSNFGKTSLTLQELYKSMISNKILLFIIVAVLLGLQNLSTEEMQYYIDDYAYQSYANQLAGPIGADKVEIIEREERKFDEIGIKQQEIIQQLKNHEIDYGEYMAQLSEIEGFAQMYKGFSKAKDQYTYLENLEAERGIRGSFISEISSQFMFDNFSRDVILAMIFSVILILAISNVFCAEYQNGMIRIIKSTKNGRSKLFLTKALICHISAILVAAATYVPLSVTFAARYKISDWSAPIQSIKLFENVQYSISIMGAAAVSIVCLAATVFAVTNVVLLLSQLVKKQNLTIILSLLLLVLPLIFGYLSVNIVQMFSTLGGFTMFSVFASYASVVPVVIYGIFIAAVWVLCAVFARKKFVN